MASRMVESGGSTPASAAAGPLLAADWASTPLGPIEQWPVRLRLAAEICMHATLPSAICWGPDRTLIHNSAWQPLLGGEARLGRPAAEAMGPFWQAVASAVEQVVATGEGAFVRDQPLEFAGERSWWNINLLPLFDDEGRIAGVLNQANDVTKPVTLERRLSYLIGLADRLRLVNDPEEVKAAATAYLGEYLGAARVGYAEVDEDQGRVWVKSDWTSDPSVATLAGQSAPLAGFGEEALGLLRAGEVIAIPDLQALPSGADIAGMEAMGVRSLVTVPLVREGALKALLYVHEPEARVWSRAEAAIARDTAERTWSAVVRAQAEQSLRESEDHYRHAVELNPQVAWTSLPDGRLNRVASRWREWTGTSGLDGSWKEGMHPEDHERTLSQWARCLETGQPYDVEHRVRRLDGNYRWARSRAYPRRDTEGNICLWYGTTEDIHERKVAEEHQRLLINELNHRVKNTLATVQAIAVQTLKADTPAADARAQFESRLMALSRAHNLLTEQNWGRASLDRVVQDATEHFAPDRFEVQGDPLWLAPRAALALALALHELGTNAAKHGALSNEGGTVAIGWRREDGLLILDWKESGGPPVTVPARRGFGSRLIEKGLDADLGGGARLAFEPDGLRCTIEASMDAIAARETSLG